MSLELKNVTIKELGIQIKFSFDIEIENNVIGRCNISIDNLLNQLVLVDDERSYFHFTPIHESCQIKQNPNNPIGQSETISREDISQESLSENYIVVDDPDQTICQQNLSENHPTVTLATVEKRNNDFTQIESLIQSEKTTEKNEEISPHISDNDILDNTENQSKDKKEAAIEKPNKKRRSKSSGTDTKVKRAFLCKTCWKYYPSKSHLDRHLQTHTKPFQCKDCGKWFSQEQQLKVHHDNIHKGIKYFKCTECDKGFVTQLRLDAHIRSHQGIKPFKCQVCGLCFSWKRSLVTHEKNHQGDDPFICGECGKEFKERKDLKAHTGEIHKGGKPFNCCKCSKNFSRRSHLTRHYASHHR